MNKKNLKKIFFSLKTGRNRFCGRNERVSSPLNPMLLTSPHQSAIVIGVKSGPIDSRFNTIYSHHTSTMNNNKTNKPINKKLVVVGDPGCGKTQLLYRSEWNLVPDSHSTALLVLCCTVCCIWILKSECCEKLCDCCTAIKKQLCESAVFWKNCVENRDI